MLLAAARLLVVAWLPGAVVFRLPVADRDRRAALPADERLFWQVVISVAISICVALALAALQRYSFTRLMAADAGIAAVLAAAARFRLRLRAAPPTAASLVVIGLIALGLWRFFPPSEYVTGGKDPGAYINEGILIAQRGALVYEDPVVRSVPPFARDLFFPSHNHPDYYGMRFMGFFIQDPARGAVIGQFPHVLPASVAIGYGVDGLTGARRTIGFWAVMGVVAVYLAGARLIGRTAAAAASALLALNVIEVWFGRYPNAEVAMQALLFAGLLANARAHVDDQRFFAPVAGVLLGLLLFLRFDAVLAVGAVLAGNALGWFSGQRVRPAFLAILAAAVALAALYLLGPMRAYAHYPFSFILNLTWRHWAMLIGAAVLGTAVLIVGRRKPAARRTVLTWAPMLLVVVVWALAVYAFFLRHPAGKLAVHDALALRMYAAFYVTVPALAAALAGYALVVRRRFWHDPALIVTITIFAAFFFFKIRIVPEHFWAARRFLPVILPGTLLLACAAATIGFAHPSPRRRLISGALGFAFIALLAVQYVRAARPVAHHTEYAGMIPQLERLAGRVGDDDLLIVESRDAGSDTHIVALPLAYIYARNVLVLSSARPDKVAFAGFLDWARTKYAHVYFLGEGGTDLVSLQWSARPVASQRFQVDEYESTVNAPPRGSRQKKFDLALYEILPPSRERAPWFDLDVGLRDDLHVVRFHAKEEVGGRTVRWSQRQSFVALAAAPSGAREVLLTMSNGGRPEAAAPADVSVYLNDRLLGTVRVTDGFRPYAVRVPADVPGTAARSGEPPILRLLTPVWNPHDVLGSGDDRDLGVMVDRVQVR